MFKTKGGGVKGFLNNVKKNCTFLQLGFPKCWALTSDVNLVIYIILMILSEDFTVVTLAIEDITTPNFCHDKNEFFLRHHIF